MNTIYVERSEIFCKSWMAKVIHTKGSCLLEIRQLSVQYYDCSLSINLRSWPMTGGAVRARHARMMPYRSICAADSSQNSVPSLLVPMLPASAAGCWRVDENRPSAACMLGCSTRLVQTLGFSPRSLRLCRRACTSYR